MAKQQIARPDRLTQAVLKVGDGRGFVVTLGNKARAIITAAHCLPDLPPCHPAACPEELTYRALLGPLGDDELTVSAECLFADPIADVAVLGMPDNQLLSDEADAFEALVAKTCPLAIADAPAQGRKRIALPALDQSIEVNTPGLGPVRVLSLDGRWIDGHVQRRGGWLSVEPEKLIASGMSGSPIVSMMGAAIGVISVTQRNPVLVDGLSARLLRTITAKPK